MNITKDLEKQLEGHKGELFAVFKSEDNSVSVLIKGDRFEVLNALVNSMIGNEQARVLILSATDTYLNNGGKPL